MTVCEGDKYKLEVEEQYYQLYWLLKDSYYLMYRFEKDSVTGYPEFTDKEATMTLCEDLYEGPGIIPIRDQYVKISLQTHSNKLDFTFRDGFYTMRVFGKGKKLKEEKSLDNIQFFQLLKEKCKCTNNLLSAFVGSMKCLFVLVTLNLGQ